MSIDKFHCYIGCIHHSIGDEELLTLAKCFSDHVISAKTIRIPGKNIHLGYGFVQYRDSAYADEAIAKMQGLVCKGIPLYIRAAYPFTSTTINSNNEEEAKDVKNATIYISDLTMDATDNDVRKLAEPFGDIDYISVIPNRKFGFLTFSRREYAMGFICHMDGWNTNDTVEFITLEYMLFATTTEFASTENEKKDAVDGQQYAFDLLPKNRQM
ncbi:bifunctional Nucleotide-binding alpha-beta plait domain superfamily/RNA recognition motif domain/RNA-binding domain superfamily [Babesia duncani]|uniref:Bifunctional Nucleotide-binding alpha-beta plait domain superfamily/RNA recognition motif domain/RNA-binding domain superfamily n=1 Tax=Babesia duncani TaxID=323732 RepID=A0AAD9UPR5_9APIC|nr:bifunctional Nucleotide-binding alpha-beta plait domain superfamily/RNA recognition motif domain/RNA-binding domain superfamily [Babesia duncani]